MEQKERNVTRQTTMSKTLEQFEQYLDKMKKYEHINTLLYWDMRTCAPKLGQAGHIDALTYFSTESFAMSTSDELYGMLETLKTPEEFAQLSDTMKFIVTRMQRDMEKDRRIPKDRYEVMVREQAESGNAWEDAKNASDFSGENDCTYQRNGRLHGSGQRSL